MRDVAERRSIFSRSSMKGLEIKASKAIWADDRRQEFRTRVDSDAAQRHFLQKTARRTTLPSSWFARFENSQRISGGAC